jgi:hypothetical protein
LTYGNFLQGALFFFIGMLNHRVQTLGTSHSLPDQFAT